MVITSLSNVNQNNLVTSLLVKLKLQHEKNQRKLKFI